MYPMGRQNNNNTRVHLGRSYGSSAVSIVFVQNRMSNISFITEDRPSIFSVSKSPSRVHIMVSKAIRVYFVSTSSLCTLFINSLYKVTCLPLKPPNPSHVHSECRLTASRVTQTHMFCRSNL